MTIALLTDFGTKDYFVGAMKGVILSINAKANVIDITHEIEPQNIRAAAFTLGACYRDFPLKTIFVAVVDPGVGSERRPILVAANDYYFIAPDNGLLSFIFHDDAPFKVFELSNGDFFKHPVSSTFHGRDIFAPCAAHLSLDVPAGRFGEEISDFVILEKTKPRKTADDAIEAEIIYSDRFGNLVTNLKKTDLPQKFYIEFGGRRINKTVRFFAEAEPDEIFMIFGSAGFLEIAAFEDSAKILLEAEIGDKIKAIIED